MIPKESAKKSYSSWYNRASLLYDLLNQGTVVSITSNPPMACPNRICLFSCTFTRCNKSGRCFILFPLLTNACLLIWKLNIDPFHKVHKKVAQFEFNSVFIQILQWRLASGNLSWSIRRILGWNTWPIDHVPSKSDRLIICLILLTFYSWWINLSINVLLSRSTCQSPGLICLDYWLSDSTAHTWITGHSIDPTIGNHHY